MKQHKTTSWHSFLDLRLLLVLLVIGLLTISWRPSFWSAPSDAVFHLGQWMFPAARQPPQVALLTVERPEASLWNSRGASPGRGDVPLGRVLQTLAEQSRTVGLVLRHPVGTFDFTSAELGDLLETPGASLKQELRERLEERQRLRQLLASNGVVLGLADGRTAGQVPLNFEQGSLETTLPPLRRWLWPIQRLDHAVNFPEADLAYYPLLTQPRREQPLVFEAEGEIYSGFALELLHQYYRRTGDVSAEVPGPRWRRDAGLVLADDIQVPLSARGDLVPRVRGYSVMEPSFARLSLAAALSRPVKSGLVLIGSPDNPDLEKLAATLVALTDGLSMAEPHWFSPLNKSLLLLVMTALLVGSPRLTGIGALVGAAGLALVFLVAQFVAQVIYNWWLPAADLVGVLAVGLVVMRLWQSKQDRRLETQRRLRLMSIAHAQRLTELGELQQAHQTLTTYAPTSQAYQPYMALAEAFARRGDYEQALKTVAALQAPKNKLEELREKQSYWSERASTKAEATNLATTLVMELEGPMVLGRYEIQRELGRGAMGTVYLAYDPKISRKVAIKTLNFNHFEEPQLADIKDRFFREAAAAGRLNHPHIVSVFDVGEEQDLAFIAMDFVDGQPLSKFVTEGALLSPFEAYRAVAHVARALNYAHENNIIHRDIKPANIIYAADPYQLKVTDFGIARLVDESRTSTGEILGSPLYIAPEQLQGKTITPRVDIFSLGVTFYQLLTGELPFAGDSLASLTYDIIYGKPQSVRKLRPDLPASATRIVNRALQKDVNKRFQSALEMAEALEKAIRRDFPSEAKAAGYTL